MFPCNTADRRPTESLRPPWSVDVIAPSAEGELQQVEKDGKADVEVLNSELGREMRFGSQIRDRMP